MVSLTKTVLFTLRRKEQQVTAGVSNPIKKLVVGVITDTGESCRTVGAIILVLSICVELYMTEIIKLIFAINVSSAEANRHQAGDT